MSLQVQFNVRYFSGTNVVGILMGTSHPEECVVMSTHHDHLGIDPNAPTDKIYNGAEDNASGVSALLAAAVALGLAGPFPRSICFLSFTAEEYGLLGAWYYAAKPVVTPIADINFDIVNLYGSTRDIVGLGAELSELKYYFKNAANEEGLYVSEDPNPSAGSFFRSDTFAFAKTGVPSVYIWSGKDYIGQSPTYYQKVRSEYVQERYHQPSDEYDPKWSMSGVLQQLRVAVRLCYGLASGSIRPYWFKDTGFQIQKG